MAVFLNVSNHSSEQWGGRQRAEAEKYGEVKDLRFPCVSADASVEEVDRIAMQTFEEICRYDCSVVMLQGEFTLTYRLVRLLKQAGIRVVAACSERRAVEQVDEEGNSVKYSQFTFVQFREY